NAPGAAISRRNSFPLRTLVVCFTIWLIATEVLIFDQIKFNVRTELLEQATRAIRGPQLSVPTERPSNQVPQKWKNCKGKTSDESKTSFSPAPADCKADLLQCSVTGSKSLAAPMPAASTEL